MAKPPRLNKQASRNRSSNKFTVRLEDSGGTTPGSSSYTNKNNVQKDEKPNKIMQSRMSQRISFREALDSIPQSQQCEINRYIPVNRNIQRVHLLINPDFCPEQPDVPTSVALSRPIPNLRHIYGHVDIIDSSGFEDWSAELNTPITTTSMDSNHASLYCEYIDDDSPDNYTSNTTCNFSELNSIPQYSLSGSEMLENQVTSIIIPDSQGTGMYVSELEFPTRDDESGYRSMMSNSNHLTYSIPSSKAMNRFQSEFSGETIVKHKSNSTMSPINSTMMRVIIPNYIKITEAMNSSNNELNTSIHTMNDNLQIDIKLTCLNNNQRNKSISPYNSDLKKATIRNNNEIDSNTYNLNNVMTLNREDLQTKNSNVTKTKMSIISMNYNAEKLDRSQTSSRIYSRMAISPINNQNAMSSNSNTLNSSVITKDSESNKRKAVNINELDMFINFHKIEGDNKTNYDYTLRCSGSNKLKQPSKLECGKSSRDTHDNSRFVTINTDNNYSTDTVGTLSKKSTVVICKSPEAQQTIKVDHATERIYTNTANKSTHNSKLDDRGYSVDFIPHSGKDESGLAEPSYTECLSEILQRTTNFEAIEGAMEELGTCDPSNFHWQERSPRDSLYLYSDDTASTRRCSDSDIGCPPDQDNRKYKHHSRYDDGSCCSHIEHRRTYRNKRIPSNKFKVPKTFRRWRLLASFRRIYRRRWTYICKSTQPNWTHWSSWPPTISKKYFLKYFSQRSAIWEDADAQTNALINEETGTDNLQRELKSAAVSVIESLQSFGFEPRSREYFNNTPVFPFLYNPTITSLPVNTLTFKPDTKSVSCLKRPSKLSKGESDNTFWNAKHGIDGPRIQRSSQYEDIISVNSQRIEKSTSLVQSVDVKTSHQCSEIQSITPVSVERSTSIVILIDEKISDYYSDIQLEDTATVENLSNSKQSPGAEMSNECSEVAPVIPSHSACVDRAASVIEFLYVENGSKCLEKSKNSASLEKLNTSIQPGDMKTHNKCSEKPSNSTNDEKETTSVLLVDIMEPPSTCSELLSPSPTSFEREGSSSLPALLPAYPPNIKRIIGSIQSVDIDISNKPELLPLNPTSIENENSFIHPVDMKTINKSSELTPTGLSDEEMSNDTILLINIESPEDLEILSINTTSKEKGASLMEYVDSETIHRRSGVLSNEFQRRNLIRPFNQLHWDTKSTFKQRLDSTSYKDNITPRHRRANIQSESGSASMSIRPSAPTPKNSRVVRTGSSKLHGIKNVLTGSSTCQSLYWNIAPTCTCRANKVATKDISANTEINPETPVRVERTTSIMKAVSKTAPNAGAGSGVIKCNYTTTSTTPSRNDINKYLKETCTEPIKVFNDIATQFSVLIKPNRETKSTGHKNGNITIYKPCFNTGANHLVTANVNKICHRSMDSMGQHVVSVTASTEIETNNCIAHNDNETQKSYPSLPGIEVNDKISIPNTKFEKIFTTPKSENNESGCQTIKEELCYLTGLTSVQTSVQNIIPIADKGVSTIAPTPAQEVREKEVLVTPDKKPTQMLSVTEPNITSISSYIMAERGISNRIIVNEQKSAFTNTSFYSALVEDQTENVDNVVLTANKSVSTNEQISEENDEKRKMTCEMCTSVTDLESRSKNNINTCTKSTSIIGLNTILEAEILLSTLIKKALNDVDTQASRFLDLRETTKTYPAFVSKGTYTSVGLDSKSIYVAPSNRSSKLCVDMCVQSESPSSKSFERNIIEARSPNYNTVACMTSQLGQAHSAQTTVIKKKSSVTYEIPSTTCSRKFNTVSCMTSHCGQTNSAQTNLTNKKSSLKCAPGHNFSTVSCMTSHFGQTQSVQTQRSDEICGPKICGCVAPSSRDCDTNTENIFNLVQQSRPSYLQVQKSVEVSNNPFTNSLTSKTQLKNNINNQLFSLSRLIGARRRASSCIDNYPPTAVLSSNLDADKWMRACTSIQKNAFAYQSFLRPEKELEISPPPVKYSTSEILSLLGDKNASVPSEVKNLALHDSLADVLPIQKNHEPLEKNQQQEPLYRRSLMVDAVTSDQVLKTDKHEFQHQAVPTVNETGIGTLSDTRFQHRSACVLTSKCMLPTCQPCTYELNCGKAPTTPCKFVYGEPTCVVHKHASNAEVQATATSLKSAQVETVVEHVEVGVLTPFFGMLPVSEQFSKKKSSVIGAVLSPKAYKALYETTKMIVNEDTREPPERDTSAPQVSAVINRRTPSNRQPSTNPVADAGVETTRPYMGNVGSVDVVTSTLWSDLSCPYGFTKGISAVPPVSGSVKHTKIATETTAQTSSNLFQTQLSSVPLEAKATGDFIKIYKRDSRKKGLDGNSHDNYNNVITPNDAERKDSKKSDIQQVNVLANDSQQIKCKNCKCKSNVCDENEVKSVEVENTPLETPENDSRQNNGEEIEKQLDIDPVTEEKSEECIKTNLVTSCRYYSTLLSKQLGKVKDNLTKHLSISPEVELLCIEAIRENSHISVSTMKPSGREELASQTLNYKVQKNPSSRICILSPTTCLTDICKNDKEHLKSVYTILSAIEGRMRRLNIDSNFSL